MYLLLIFSGIFSVCGKFVEKWFYFSDQTMEKLSLTYLPPTPQLMLTTQLRFVTLNVFSRCSSRITGCLRSHFDILNISFSSAAPSPSRLALCHGAFVIPTCLQPVTQLKHICMRSWSAARTSAEKYVRAVRDSEMGSSYSPWSCGDMSIIVLVPKNLSKDHMELVPTA